MIDRTLNYGRHHIERFLQEIKPSAVIVDVGAGSGADLAIAKKQCPEATLHAIDFLLANLEPLSQHGVVGHELDIEHDRFPFANDSVDVVIANQVLEHTKELFWIFHEATRILRVGGCFIVGVPNLASLHNRILLAFGHQPSPIKSASAHVRGFTKRDLTDFVDTCFPAGYRLEDFGGANFYPFPPMIARPLAKTFPTLAWGIFLKLTKRTAYDHQFLEFPRMQQLATNFFVG